MATPHQTWACLGNEHEKCNDKEMCDCRCHVEEKQRFYRQIMNDIYANSNLPNSIHDRKK